MRVLHIVSNVSVRNGVMSFLMNYYRNIDRSTLQFDFLYFNESATATFREEICALGGNVYKVESPMNYSQFSKEICVFAEKQKGQYDVIHLHEIFLIGFFYGLKKKLGAKSFVSHAHSTRFSDHTLGNIRNRIFSIPNAFLPDGLFACSLEAGKALFGKCFLKKGVVVNNAIDLNRFYPDPACGTAMKKELGLEGKFVVGHVGNFAYPKNHPFIVDVFCEIAKKREDAVLVLVGEGAFRREIAKKCRELGMENKVLFLGERKDIQRVVRAFDRFLFPSLYEGLGIVLVEAQASGLPCIFSDVVPDVVNLFPENNRVLSLELSKEKWAEAVLSETLCTIKDTKARLGEGGFDIVLQGVALQKEYGRITGEAR